MEVLDLARQDDLVFPVRTQRERQVDEDEWNRLVGAPKLQTSSAGRGIRRPGSTAVFDGDAGDRTPPPTPPTDEAEFDRDEVARKFVTVWTLTPPVENIPEYIVPGTKLSLLPLEERLDRVRSYTAGKWYMDQRFALVNCLDPLDLTEAARDFFDTVMIHAYAADFAPEGYMPLHIVGMSSRDYSEIGPFRKDANLSLYESDWANYLWQMVKHEGAFLPVGWSETRAEDLHRRWQAEISRKYHR